MFHVKQKDSFTDNSIEVFLETKDFMVSGETFRIVKKPGKNYLETQPIPEILDTYYESEAYLSHTDGKESLFEKAYQFVKQITLKQKVKSIGKPKLAKNKLLDFGAGTGDFLQVAKNNGWKVTGIEPNQHARKLAVKKGLNLFSSLDELENENFDVITLWHVLEHVPNLDQILMQLQELLNPGGLIVIALPNYKSWDAKKYGKYWAAYDVPRHLWHFDREAMKNILPKSFQQTKTKPMWFDAFYVCLLSEKYQTGKTNWFNGVFNGLRSNLKAILSKEYSSIVYYYHKNDI